MLNAQLLKARIKIGLRVSSSAALSRLCREAVLRAASAPSSAGPWVRSKTVDKWLV